MDVPIVKTRLELREVLESYLKKDVEERDKYLLEKFRRDIKPKSYIIESNLGNDIQFNSDSLVKVNLQDTKDTSLKILNIFVLNNSPLNLYLDITDKRFWIAHSLYPANLTYRAISYLINQNNSKLDFPWFASKNIEKIGEIGKETGFSLKFHDYFLEEKDESYEEKLRKISMRFWGGGANDVIKHLRNKEDLKKAISLSALELKYTSETGYIKTNISNYGKFAVVKGDSIDNYFTLINKIKYNYSEIINNIETNYRINYIKTNTGFELKGSYSIIEFKNEIEDLEKFCDRLTSCNFPFRLWGIRKNLEKDFIKINCIDLHTYDKINLELTPNWMRIFLNSKSCGNVVTRLFSNLQNYFNSEIKIKGAENENLI